MLPSLGLLVATALSYAPSPLLHRATTTARTPFIIAQQQPYRSDDKWDYFRLLRKVEVTLTKPLGAVLEETGQTAGTVKVDDLAEGGSALETGLLKKGDVLWNRRGFLVRQRALGTQKVISLGFFNQTLQHKQTTPRNARVAGFDGARGSLAFSHSHAGGFFALGSARDA